MTGLRRVQSAHAHAGVTAFMTNTAINCKGTQVGPKWDTKHSKCRVLNPRPNDRF